MVHGDYFYTVPLWRAIVANLNKGAVGDDVTIGDNRAISSGRRIGAAPWALHAQGLLVVGRLATVKILNSESRGSACSAAAYWPQVKRHRFRCVHKPPPNMPMVKLLSAKSGIQARNPRRVLYSCPRDACLPQGYGLYGVTASSFAVCVKSLFPYF